MSPRRRARLERRTELGTDVHALEFASLGDPLRFVGGQYVIADFGVVRDGKPVKRAYSLASSDRAVDRFTLIVRRHGDGAGSNAMLALPHGSEIQFSGPWGKCVATDAFESSSRIVATSVGITAAIGLLRSERFAARSTRPGLDVILADDEPPVIDATTLGDLLVEARPTIRYIRLGGADAYARYASEWIDRSVDELFLVGSGRANTEITERILVRGFDPARILVEHFFDRPQNPARVPS